MSLKVEKLEGNMAKLTIEVDAAEVEKAITKAYQKIKNQVSFPGFRKGKVPQKMIEKQYGVEVFYEDAANFMINDTYREEIKDCELEIVSAPEIGVDQLERG
ncbi:MAG: trigger factor family protein, partial [Parasporobacterium sp.]|nr:trigger factor family protein [Parasporobacterium sp.]